MLAPENIETDTVILVNNLSKQVASLDQESTDNIHILNGIELEIKASDTVAIIGASGSGKSTLLGLLAGLDDASSGEIYINQTSMSTLDEDGRAELRANTIGFVFQSFQLLPGLTALENVMLPLELAGILNPVEQATKLLSRVGLSERLQHYPNQLSGGEQQRVAIARAFITNPKIIFADEPTGNLDKHTGNSIIDLLFEVNQENGTTLVIVTHDEHLASRCNRTLLLEDGRLHAN